MGSGPEKMEQRQECAGAILQELTYGTTVFLEQYVTFTGQEPITVMSRTLIKKSKSFFL
jgi:hypothetical protein